MAKRLKRVVLASMAGAAIAVTATPAVAGPAAGPTLSSTAFADSAKIPDHYSCAFDHKPGRDVSPPLAWTAADTTVKAYAIVLRDVANGGDKVHWAIWNIPATTASLPEGLGSGFDVPGQNGAKQKAMGSGTTAQQYFGPCPGGREHPYTFTLYALKSATVPGLTASSTMAQIESAIKKASSATAVLHGKSSAAAN